MKTLSTALFVLQIGLQMFSSSSSSSSSFTGCSSKVDVLFAVDASSSVWAPDFRRHLGFVTALIRDLLLVDPDSVRCGLMTFADDARLEFGLRRHSGWEAAIRAVRQQRGDTRTDRALHRLRTVMDEEGRPGASRVGVVVTDGQSHDRRATDGEAAAALREGIAVFVVGVGGDLDRGELRGIAGGREEFVYAASTQRDLERVRERLAERICSQDLRDYFLDPPIALPECGSGSPDVTFLLDLSIALHPDNLEFGQRFVRNCASLLSASNGATRVSVVTYGESPRVRFEMDDYEDASSLLRAISRIAIDDHASVTDLSGALRLVGGGHYLGGETGGKIVVVVTGGRVGDLLAAAGLATDLRERLGGTLIFVGVGAGVDPEEMKTLAGVPTERSLLLVENYRSLGSVALELLKRVCRSVKNPISPTFSSFPAGNSKAETTESQTVHKIQSPTPTGVTRIPEIRITLPPIGVTSHPISTNAMITNSTSLHELSPAFDASSALNLKPETSSSMSTDTSTLETSTNAGVTTTSYATRDNWPFFTPMRPSRRPSKTPGCDFVQPADVVFSLPDQMGVEQTDKALRFVAITAAELHLDGFNVRMGLTPRHCPPSTTTGGFPLGEADELDHAIASQRPRPTADLDADAEAGLGSRLSYLRRRSFGREEIKGHYGAVLVAVLVLDRPIGGTGEGGAVVREASLLMDQGVAILGVATGGGRGGENREELRKVISCSGCLFSGDSLDERLAQKLTTKINELRCNRNSQTG